MARALVLGATGHIGAHIVRALIREGHSVKAAYRNERYLFVLQGLPVEKCPVDLDTLEGIRKALEGIDWVFHAAGYYPSPGVDRDRAVPMGVVSVRRLMAAIGHTEVSRIVYTSSAATIQRLLHRPATEQDSEPWPLVKPRSLYATVKIAMEQEALRWVKEGLPIVIVNPSFCIGEYDAHLLTGRLLLAYAKRRLPFFIDYAFNAVYTGDVGVGHLRAAERGQTGQRYLLAGANITLKEFADVVCRQRRIRPPWFKVPYGAVVTWATLAGAFSRLTGKTPLMTPAEVANIRYGHRLDVSKAIRELGIPQTPLSEAIHRALDWFEQNGYLK